MTTRKIGEILDPSGELQALSRPARRLAEVERLLFEAAPRSLAEAARVNGIRAGVLLVSADNAAVAAKLRQLAPRLLMQVTKRVPQVTGIKVDVQPATARGGTSPPARPQIGAAALAQLRQLASGLPESPLKAALARLVRRQEDRGAE